MMAATGKNVLFILAVPSSVRVSRCLDRGNVDELMISFFFLRDPEEMQSVLRRGSLRSSRGASLLTSLLIRMLLGPASTSPANVSGLGPNIHLDALELPWPRSEKLNNYDMAVRGVNSRYSAAQSRVEVRGPSETISSTELVRDRGVQ